MQPAMCILKDEMLKCEGLSHVNQTGLFQVQHSLPVLWLFLQGTPTKKE